VYEYGYSIAGDAKETRKQKVQLPRRSLRAPKGVRRLNVDLKKEIYETGANRSKSWESCAAVRDVVAILPIATGFEKGLIYQVFCLVKPSTVTVLVIDDMMLNIIEEQVSALNDIGLSPIHLKD